VYWKYKGLSSCCKKINLEGIWMNKENLFDKQYEITKEILNKQLKVTSKLVSDVGERANHMVIVGHEELYICLCITFFVCQHDTRVLFIIMFS
jgi:hypothetical protein